MATVIVASQAANKAKRIQFCGTTWGELKNHPEVLPLLGNGVEAIVKPGNTALTRDDASVPAGDFSLFLVPTKNKAGVYANTAAAKKLAEEIGKAIIDAEHKATTQDLEELKASLIAEIEDYFGVDLSSEENDEELKAALREASQL